MKIRILFFLLFFPLVILPQNNFIEQITSGDFDARNPFLEPSFFTNDSLRIFFELHKNGYSNIYYVKYNSSDQTFGDIIAITKDLEIDINPSFKSNIGLIFQSNLNGNWDIMFIPENDYSFGTIRNLTNSSENEISLSLSHGSNCRLRGISTPP